MNNFLMRKSFGVVFLLLFVFLCRGASAGDMNFANTTPREERNKKKTSVSRSRKSSKAVSRVDFVGDDSVSSAQKKLEISPVPLDLVKEITASVPVKEEVPVAVEEEAGYAVADEIGYAVAEEKEYTVGVSDILEISVLQPEEILRIVNVAPDGTISFPYIGTVKIKGLTIAQSQEKIQAALGDGYFKFPVVLVSLKESRSRQYLVYGAVIRPGEYAITEYSTVLRAISMAGGFSKFGSSSRVKVLRPKENAPGYKTLKIDIKRVMNGDSTKDILLKSGDMVVVSEGMF